MGNVDHDLNTLPTDPAVKAAKEINDRVCCHSSIWEQIIRAAYAEQTAECERLKRMEAEHQNCYFGNPVAKRDAEIERLRAEVAEASFERDRLRANDEDLRAKLAGYYGAYDTMTEVINGLKAELLAEQNETKTLRVLHGQAVDELASVRREYEPLVCELASVREERDRLRAELATANTHVREHRAELVELVDRNTDLAAELATARADIASAREEINRLAAKISGNAGVKPCEHRSLADTLTEEDVEWLAAAGRAAYCSGLPYEYVGWDRCEEGVKQPFRRFVWKLAAEFSATPTRDQTPGTLLAIRALLIPALAGIETAHEAIGKVPELITALMTGEKGAQL